jgi:hypothetical protein
VLYQYSTEDKQFSNIYFKIISADIVECFDGNHTCDANAQCNNTVGSYLCECRSGFMGDGKTCTGIL